jgi:hypothetical protein
MTQRLIRSGVLLATLLLLGPPRPADAGLITFGGDLASALGAPISTPSTIGLGTSLATPFSGTIAGVGQVQGTVTLTNNAAGTAGSIRLTGFDLVSFKTAPGSSVGFTLNVSQDFVYSAAPQVVGTGTLAGSYTFAGLQAGAVSLTGAVNSVPIDTLNSNGLGMPSSSGSVPIGPLASRLVTAGATGTVHLDFFLGVTLSSAGGGPAGPRVDLSLAEVRYLPEPSTLLLSSLGVVLLAGLGTVRRTRARGSAGPGGRPGRPEFHRDQR